MSFTRLARPVPALPVDLVRICVGLVALGYVTRLFVDAPWFSGPDGLIDHAASREALWFTAQPLFLPGQSLLAVRAILGVAMLLAVAVIVGVAPRVAAALLYVIVVCHYRHAFLVFYVDDVVVHLLLLWVALLPCGRTLAIGRRSWRGVMVPGLAVRMLLANVALVYLVAGVTKWTSALWRSGDALYAVLKLPIAWSPERWSPADLPWLTVANHAALVIEPLLALLVVLPTGHRVKWFLGGALVAFHLGIIATLDVPFANLGCLAVAPLLFREELMHALEGRRAAPPMELPRDRAEPLAVLVLVLLVGAMSSAVLQTGWRSPSRVTGTTATAPVSASTAETGGLVQTTFYAGLYVLGLVQGYRLLDWIDDRNFEFTLAVRETAPDGSTRDGDVARLRRFGGRGSLFYTYLGGITWMHVPADRLEPLRVALRRKLAARYCSTEQRPLTVEVLGTLVRTTARQPSPPETTSFARFTCEAGRATLLDSSSR